MSSLLYSDGEIIVVDEYDEMMKKRAVIVLPANFMNGSFTCSFDFAL
jgi:hypothetical protein